jgi:hypothetical protein
LGYTTLGAGPLPLDLLLPFEGLGVLLLLGGLALRWRVLTGIGIFPLVAPASVVLVERGPLLLAPLLGIVVLASAELSFWSIDVGAFGSTAPGLIRFLGLRLTAMVVVGLLLGMAILALGGVGASGTLDLTVFGALAAAAVMGLTVWLIRGGL